MARKAPTLTDKHVASRMRLRRLHIGMSQEELAQALGLTFQQVQKYEKGTNRISAGRLQEVARVLSVPLTFFFEGGFEADPAKSGDDASRLAEVLASPEVAHLVRALTRVNDPRLWKSITNLAVAVADGMEANGSAPKALRRRSS